MKSIALHLSLAAMTCDAAVIRPRSGLLRVNTSAARPHGLANCPCIGVDQLEGKTMVTLPKMGGKQAEYPADLGARCKAWDANSHPKCPGESWCESKWCYVDPCNCDKISPYPDEANYLPGAQYQGKPLHFSYATCDDMDSYTENKKSGNYEAIQKTCSVEVDSSKWGHENCRCVGISPQGGSMKVDIDGKKHDFPADTGATCKKWEADNHPECKGSSPPSWCNQAWCYVDPCSCKQAVPPKTSDYLPGSNYQGRPIYYSYATCGGTDKWSAGSKDACVNQKNQEACAKLSKCAWDGKDCLGKELVSVCQSGAWSAKAIVALALPLLGFAF